jgi:chloramphenicol-sensitive protein RarD
MNGQKTGNLLAISSYLIWGALPLYWALLDSVNPLVVLAYRVLFSLALLSPILLFVKWRGEVKRVLTDRRKTLKALVAGLLIFANWGLFIWGLEQGLHVQVSFGYYFSPLLQIALGALFLKERMEPATMAASALALVAVAYLMISDGVFPWYSVLLAATFAAYGLVKKKVDTDAYTGLFLETMFSAPLAIALLVIFGLQSGIAFGQSWGISLLLIGAGPVTAIPLMLYSEAARRIPLTSLGFFQYFSPSLTLVLGVTVFHKPVTHAEMIGFIVVWIALAVYSVGAIYRIRKSRALEQV